MLNQRREMNEINLIKAYIFIIKIKKYFIIKTLNKIINILKLKLINIFKKLKQLKCIF